MTNIIELAIYRKFIDSERAILDQKQKSIDTCRRIAGGDITDVDRTVFLERAGTENRRIIAFPTYRDQVPYEDTYMMYWINFVQPHLLDRALQKHAIDILVKENLVCRLPRDPTSSLQDGPRILGEEPQPA